METSRSPFSSTSDSDLYSTTADPYDADNQSMIKTHYHRELTVPASIIASIEIPFICLAIYAVYSLIKSKLAPLVFLINLLISDLIQIVGILLLNVSFSFVGIIMWAGYTGLYFMTCIAVERYVLIAHPIWHRCHSSVKCFVCTSLTGWVIPFIVFLVCIFINVLAYIMPFIPYLVIIVCFVGTCRSLSRSISLTPLKKQLVMAPLLSVVIIYTCLILPFQICTLLFFNNSDFPIILFDFSFMLYLLNPLVDCMLYVFMRNNAEKIIRMPHCCSRLKRVWTETGQTTSTDVQHA